MTGVSTSGGVGKNAGSYTHSVSGSSDNYALNFVNGALTINPAALSITANSATKTYGETKTFAGTEFSSTGLQNSETVGSVTLTSAGSVATVGVAGSPYSITASNATGGTFNPSNYNISYTNGQLTVDKFAMIVTATEATKNYGQTVSFSGQEFVSTILPNGERVNSITLTSDGAAATAGVAGSPYSIIPSNATGTFDPANYSITYNNNQLTVNPAALTITANNASKTYGETTTFAGTEFSSAGLQNSETVGSVTLTSAGSVATAGVAGSPYSITASNATGGSFNPANYSISYANGQLTVNKKDATVTANSTSVSYNGLNQSVTGFTATGLVNGEATTVLTGVSTTGGSGTNAGSYVHTPSGSDGNYNLSFINGALTINPAALTITANNAIKTYGELKTFAGTEFSPAGLQNSETLGSVTLTSAGSAATAGVAGSPYSITPGNATGGTFNPANYSITYKNGILTVIPTLLLMSPAPDFRTTTNFAPLTPPYSGGNGVKYLGFVNGDDQNSLQGSLIYGGTSQGAYLPGTYTIIPGGLTRVRSQSRVFFRFPIER